MAHGRMNPACPFAAALLAGGASTRMGTDKALLDWHGVPLWRAQLGKLMDLNPAWLLLSCRENQHLKNVFAEFVFDPPDNPGPMGAIARCLEITRLPLLVLAVDMPHMTPAFLRSMLDACPDASCGLVCRTTEGFEPLCALYPPGAWPLFQESLLQKNWRLQSLAGRLVAAGLLRARDLKPDEVPLFFNANTPEEYAWTTSLPPASN